MIYLKLSKPLKLFKKKSPHIEILNSVFDTTKIKKYLFKLIYFIFSSSVLTIPPPHKLKQTWQGEKSVTCTFAHKSMETLSYQEV